jgi:tetratricopeptide (TPR) repeat protein
MSSYVLRGVLVAGLAVCVFVSCAGPNEFTRGKALVDEAQGTADKAEAAELYKEAVPELESATAEGIGGAEAFYYLGVALYRTGDAARAIDAFQTAIERDTDYLWPRYEMGLVYFNQKEYDSAEAQLTRAVGIDPDYTWAWHYLGRTYEAKGQPAKAVEALEKASVAGPSIEYNYIYLGRLHRKAGRDADALKAYKKYLEIGETPALRTEAQKAIDEIEPAGPGIREIRKQDPADG